MGRLIWQRSVGGAHFASSQASWCRWAPIVGSMTLIPNALWLLVKICSMIHLKSRKEWILSAVFSASQVTKIELRQYFWVCCSHLQGWNAGIGGHMEAYNLKRWQIYWVCNRRSGSYGCLWHGCKESKKQPGTTPNKKPPISVQPCF